jgi:hypothetical protein
MQSTNERFVYIQGRLIEPILNLLIINFNIKKAEDNDYKVKIMKRRIKHR